MMKPNKTIATKAMNSMQRLRSSGMTTSTTTTTTTTSISSTSLSSSPQRARLLSKEQQRQWYSRRFHNHHKNQALQQQQQQQQQSSSFTANALQAYGRVYGHCRTPKSGLVAWTIGITAHQQVAAITKTYNEGSMSEMAAASLEASLPLSSFTDDTIYYCCFMLPYYLEEE